MAINLHSISKPPISTNPNLFNSNSSSIIFPNSFLGNFPKFSSRTTHPLFFNSTKKPPISAIVSFSLPTANPERIVGEKLPKWSSRAIKSFAMGELEARKLKYPTTGTEAILMGILVEGTSPASKFLRENGVTLFKVRDESIKLLGKGDFYFFSPEHPPLTESAQNALDWAVDNKLKSGQDGEITTSELLLGIWSEVESPGHKILASLGFSEFEIRSYCVYVARIKLSLTELKPIFDRSDPEGLSSRIRLLTALIACNYGRAKEIQCYYLSTVGLLYWVLDCCYIVVLSVLLLDDNFRSLHLPCVYLIYTF